MSKANPVIEAAYRLTLSEQRILLACLSKLDPAAQMPRWIRLYAWEYAEIYGLSMDRAYHALRDGAAQ
ncbi:MAG: replication initiation protein, partial [Candidatus Thiodiazotropha sp.]